MARLVSEVVGIMFLASSNNRAHSLILFLATIVRFLIFLLASNNWMPYSRISGSDTTTLPTLSNLKEKYLQILPELQNV